MFMIKRTKLTRAAINEFTFRTKILSVIAIILGLGLLAGSIVIYFRSQDKFEIVLMVLCGFVALLGLIMLIFTYINIARVIKSEQEVEMEFGKESVSVRSYEHGKKVRESKYLYTEFLSYRVIKDYMFLYINRRMAFPLLMDNDIHDIIELFESHGVRRK